MPAMAILRLGERIRGERGRQGVSLRGLARSVGLSPSLISQIETGRCRPSVSTLYAITTALGISVEEVFGDRKSEPVSLGPAQRQADGSRSGPVLRPREREVLELESGVTWERLGHAPGSAVDFLLVTYPPGSCSSAAGQLMRHAGTEHGYLLRGELVVTVGFGAHRMTAGDAISFPSVTPHAYRNEGPEPAVGVWFIAEADALSDDTDGGLSFSIT